MQAQANEMVNSEATVIDTIDHIAALVSHYDDPAKEEDVQLLPDEPVKTLTRSSRRKTKKAKRLTKKQKEYAEFCRNTEFRFTMHKRKVENSGTDGLCDFAIGILAHDCDSQMMIYREIENQLRPEIDFKVTALSRLDGMQILMMSLVLLGLGAVERKEFNWPKAYFE